jgi:hypothetical protein
MKKLILYSIVLLFFTGCDRFMEFGGEEVLDDISVGIEPKLVVEAMVTELDTLQIVKLSTTKRMSATDQNNLVRNALVEVKGGGNTYRYQYVDSLKSYVARFKGIPGHEYTLSIEWNGKRYSARETMANLQHFDIDSIAIKKARYDFQHWRYFEAGTPFRSLKGEEILIALNSEHPTQDTLIGGRIFNHHAVYINPLNRSEVLTNYKYGDLAEFWFGGDPYVIQAASEERPMNVYKVSLYSKVSMVESNYYRFVIKRNGRSWLHPGQLIVANDFAIGENISGIEFPGFFIEGDQVEFVMYGISRRAYNFYMSLQSVLNNDGGNYSSIPGNPPTNVFDEHGKPALGYFEVNKVASVKRIVKANKIHNY